MAKAVPCNAADVAVMVGVGFISAVGVIPEETVQQTARGQELHGDLTWRGVYELARCPITASPHRECSQLLPKNSTPNPRFCFEKNIIQRLNDVQDAASHRDVILVCDEAGNVIEKHERAREFKQL